MKQQTAIERKFYLDLTTQGFQAVGIQMIDA